MNDLSRVVTGPLWAACNWSTDEGAGSIHDDETAENLGFRGGTVAGDIHMNQFPPVMLKTFGNEWFERGHLSLNFRNATIDKERVQVFATRPEQSGAQTRVWMEREDGMLVCEGTAAVGSNDESALRSIDYRACDPEELQVLRRVKPGMSLGDYDVLARPDNQFDRYDKNLISDPLSWYRHDSPWGGPLAAPCTVLEFLWGSSMIGLAPLVEEATSLFGAMEIAFTKGPMLLDKDYHIETAVVCVGQSPKTEYVWYEQKAFDQAGDLVVTLLIQSRAMKASSPLYQ